MRGWRMKQWGFSGSEQVCVLTQCKCERVWVKMILGNWTFWCFKHFWPVPWTILAFCCLLSELSTWKETNKPELKCLPKAKSILMHLRSVFHPWSSNGRDTAFQTRFSLFPIVNSGYLKGHPQENRWERHFSKTTTTTSKSPSADHETTSCLEMTNIRGLIFVK